MLKYSRLVLGALTAAVALSALAGTATANRSIGIAPGGEITATGSVVFENGAGTSLLSLVTLTGTQSRNVGKSIGTVVEIISGCRSTLAVDLSTGFIFRVRCDLSLPWTTSYNGFTGTLPNITSVRLIDRNVSILIEDLGSRGESVLRCLYSGDIAYEFRVSERRVRQRSIEARAAALRPRTLIPIGAGCTLTPQIRISGALTYGAGLTLSLV